MTISLKLPCPPGSESVFKINKEIENKAHLLARFSNGSLLSSLCSWTMSWPCSAWKTRGWRWHGWCIAPYVWNQSDQSSNQKMLMSPKCAPKIGGGGWIDGCPTHICSSELNRINYLICTFFYLKKKKSFRKTFPVAPSITAFSDSRQLPCIAGIAIILAFAWGKFNLVNKINHTMNSLYSYRSSCSVVWCWSY